MQDKVSATGVDINTNGNTSTSGNLKASDTVYSGIQTLSGLSGADKDNYSFADIKGDYKVDKLALKGSIAQSHSTYGDSLVAGSVTLTNKVANDLIDANVAIDTTGHSSSSGHLKAANSPYVGIQSISSLTGNDAANYSFANLSGDYAVNQRILTIDATPTTLEFTGSLLKQTTPKMTGVVSGDNVVVTGEAQGVVKGEYLSNLVANGLDAGNYKTVITNTSLIISHRNEDLINPVGPVTPFNPGPSNNSSGSGKVFVSGQSSIGQMGNQLVDDNQECSSQSESCECKEALIPGVIFCLESPSKKVLLTSASVFRRA
jgi:hypothetical protein